jgi:hypothetical protein
MVTIELLAHNGAYDKQKITVISLFQSETNHHRPYLYTNLPGNSKLLIQIKILLSMGAPQLPFTRWSHNKLGETI